MSSSDKKLCQTRGSAISAVETSASAGAPGGGLNSSSKRYGLKMAVGNAAEGAGERPASAATINKKKNAEDRKEPFSRAWRSLAQARFRSKLQPQGKLDDPRVVHLPAQIEQTCILVEILLAGAGQVVNGMVKDIEEVCGEPQPEPLHDIEILENREILVPITGTEQEILRVRRKQVRYAGGPDSSVGQPDIHPVAEIGTNRPQLALRTVRRHKAFERAKVDIRRLGWIEITRKPQLPILPEDIHG